MLVLVSVIFATACASRPRPENVVLERYVRFVCASGEEVEMQFFPQQRTAVLVWHGQNIELQQQPAGSGFIYSNGPNTVRGKGNELTVEIGRMAPLDCKARPAAESRR